MKKIIWIAGVIICLVITGLVIWTKKNHPQYSSYGNKVSNIKLNGADFSVEIVSAGEKVALGLSGRESICEKCGMLFVFDEEAYRSFWMKDMKFDLDMIWISGDKIVHVAKNVRHEKGTKEVVRPDAKADKVLEVNAGASDKLGWKVGDKVILK